MRRSWPSLVPVGLLAWTSLRPAIAMPAPKDVFRWQFPTADDHSWVTKFAAVGDSYAAGIGAGDIMTHDDPLGSCSRYDLSYPQLIQSDARMGPKDGRTFQHLACSGATSQEILEEQVPRLEGGQKLITVSAGGNDVGFADVVMDCIYQIRPVGPDGCDKTLDALQKKVENELEDNLMALGKALVKKLDGGNQPGTMYWTGYAKFWNDQTDGCNDQSWATWYNVDDVDRVFLTKENRRRMNKMTDEVNVKIVKVVKSLGEQVVFVNYDDYFGQSKGRFCDVGVTEPDESRPGLLFYNWNTKDREDEEDGGDELKRATVGAVMRENATETGNATTIGKIAGGRNFTAPRNLTATANFAAFDKSESGSGSDKTFEEALWDAMQKTQEEHPDWRYGPDKKQMPDDRHAPRSLLDGWKKVFHPRPLGHSIIANLVLYKMTEARARSLDLPVPEEVATVDTCSTIDWDEGEDEDEAEDDEPAGKQCNGPSSRPWMSQPAAEDAIKQFCGDDQNLQGKPDTTTEKEYFGDSNEAVTISIDWTTNKRMPKGTCESRFQELIDDCDRDEDETHKRGGTWGDKDYGALRLSPQVEGDHVKVNCFDGAPSDDDDITSAGSYVTGSIVRQNIDEFCEKYATKSLEAGPRGFGEWYNKDTFDALSLSLDWKLRDTSDKASISLSKAECTDGFDRLIDRCGGNDAKENPMGWVYGGVFMDNEVFFGMNAQERAANRRAPAPKEPVAKCKSTWKVAANSFEIYGGGWASWDWGQKTFLSNVTNCMGSAVSFWKFDYFDKPDEDGFEWKATGNTAPIQRACYSPAINGAGGGKVDCPGTG